MKHNLKTLYEVIKDEQAGCVVYEEIENLIEELQQLKQKITKKALQQLKQKYLSGGDNSQQLHTYRVIASFIDEILGENQRQAGQDTLCFFVLLGVIVSFIDEILGENQQ